MNASPTTPAGGNAPGFSVLHVLVLLVGLLAYGIALKSDFYMDDYMHILNSEELQEGRWADKTFREIPYLAWSVVLRTAGPSPVAFHALNLAVHLANTLLTIALAGAFLRRAGWLGSAAERERAALLAGLLFACHPLGSEAVFYARCLMIQSVTLFSLVAGLMVFRCAETRRWPYALAALVAIAAASRCKQPGLFHAAATAGICAVMAIDWRGLRRVTLRGTDWAAIGVGGLVFVGLAWNGVQYWLAKAWHQVGSEAFIGHTLTQGRVFWGYLWRIVAPVGLSSDHYIPESTSAADLPALAGAIAAFLLMAAAVALLFRSRHRAVGALACLALVHLGMRFLYVIPEFMVEYRVYPSMPWIALALALPLAMAFRWQWKAGAYATIATTVALVLLCVFRGAVWQDSTRLAGDVLERYPLNNRARNVVMLNDYRAGDYEAVRTTFREAVLAYQAAEAFNADGGARVHRRYEPLRLQQNLVGALNLNGLALAEAESVEVAIKFIDGAIRQVNQLKTSDHYRENDDRELAELLIESRAVLEEHGKDYENARGGS